jgi:hypothetical protein
MMEQQRDISRAPGGHPDPASPNHAPVVTTTEARSGVTFGTMRWVVILSILGGLAAIAVIWMLIAG